MAKECMTCKSCSLHEKKLLESSLSDHGGTVFSSLVRRMNSKAHANIITKKHTEDLRVMTPQEWVDILPVLKETIKKIDKTYHPLGYRISIPIGEKAGQNVPYHFYMRIVPKYKKDWGSVGNKPSISGKQVTDKEIKILKEAFQPKQNNVVDEKNKVVTRFHEELELPCVTISTKQHLPNNIDAIDAETWAEIGQTLKELMKKMEDKDACHDFIMKIELGKEAFKIWKEEAEVPSNYDNDYPDSEFTVILFNRYKMGRWWLPNERRLVIGNKLAGSYESDRISLKIRDPKAYAKIWGKSKGDKLAEAETELAAMKVERERESKTQTYWMTGTGVTIGVLLLIILGMVWKMRKKQGN